MRTTKPTSARNAAMPTRKMRGEVRRRISDSVTMDRRTWVHVGRGYRLNATIASFATPSRQRRRSSPAMTFLEHGRASRRLGLRLEPAAVGQHFGDLHRVQGRALPQIVGDAPEVEALLDRRVLADAADIGRVLASRLVRGDVAAGLAPVDDEAARRLAQDPARFLGADR